MSRKQLFKNLVLLLVLLYSVSCNVNHDGIPEVVSVPPPELEDPEPISIGDFTEYEQWMISNLNKLAVKLRQNNTSIDNQQFVHTSLLEIMNEDSYEAYINYKNQYEQELNDPSPTPTIPTFDLSHLNLSPAAEQLIIDLLNLAVDNDVESFHIKLTARIDDESFYGADDHYALALASSMRAYSTFAITNMDIFPQNSSAGGDCPTTIAATTIVGGILGGLVGCALVPIKGCVAGAGLGAVLLGVTVFGGAGAIGGYILCTTFSVSQIPPEFHVLFPTAPPTTFYWDFGG